MTISPDLMVAYLSNEIQKRYQKLTFTNAMLDAAESLLQESAGLHPDFQAKVNDHHSKLSSEFIAEVNEVQSMELYKAYYAGRLLQSLNTETATKN